MFANIRKLVKERKAQDGIAEKRPAFVAENVGEATQEVSKEASSPVRDGDPCPRSIESDDDDLPEIANILRLRKNMVEDLTEEHRLGEVLEKAQERATKKRKFMTLDEDLKSIRAWPALPYVSVAPQKKEPLYLEHNGFSCSVPDVLNQHMRPYQKQGVEWLFKKFAEDTGGILGDDMGLGKTIQTIAFLCAIYNKSCTHKDLHPRRFEEGPCLIVCPASLIENWKNELLIWAPFTVGLCCNDRATRKEVLEHVEGKKLEVMIISYDSFKSEEYFGRINEIPWKLVICDEADHMKNDNSVVTRKANMLACRRRIGLTGTVMQNKYLDIWTLFDWCSCNKAGDKSHFKSEYAQPVEAAQVPNASAHVIRRGEIAKNKLHNLVKKFLLRRDKREIKDQLPGKEDNVVYCPLSPIQQYLYIKALCMPDFQLITLKDEICPCKPGNTLKRGKCHFKTGSYDGTYPLWESNHPNGPCQSCPTCMGFPCLDKLLKISNHPERLKPHRDDPPRKREKAERFCRVLFDDQLDHLGGVNECRDLNQLCSPQYSGKMKALQVLFDRWVPQTSTKILLFSYSTRQLDILQVFLNARGMDFVRLDGSTPVKDRQSIVDQFNLRESIKVMLLSTRAGGVGLNITSANKVVIFDPNWNPSRDLQAQDRAFRIGQQRYVSVYRLVCGSSLEENIYSRQVIKQQYSNMALENTTEKRIFDMNKDLKGLSNLLKLNVNAVKNAWNRAEAEGQLREQEEWLLQPRNTKDATMDPEELGEDLDNDDHGLDEIMRESGEDEDAPEHTGHKDDPTEARQEMDNLFGAGFDFIHRNTDLVGEDKDEARRVKLLMSRTKEPEKGGKEVKSNHADKTISHMDIQEPLALLVSGSSHDKKAIEMDDVAATERKRLFNQLEQDQKRRLENTVVSNEKKRKLFHDLVSRTGVPLLSFCQVVERASRDQRTKLLTAHDPAETFSLIQTRVERV